MADVPPTMYESRVRELSGKAGSGMKEKEDTSTLTLIRKQVRSPFDYLHSLSRYRIVRMLETNSRSFLVTWNHKWVNDQVYSPPAQPQWDHEKTIRRKWFEEPAIPQSRMSTTRDRANCGPSPAPILPQRESLRRRNATPPKYTSRDQGSRSKIRFVVDIDTKTYPEDCRPASTSKRNALIKYPLMESRDLSPKLEYFSDGNDRYILRDQYEHTAFRDKRAVKTTTETYWRRRRP